MIANGAMQFSSPVEVIFLVVSVVLTLGLAGFFIFVLTRKGEPKE